MKPREREGTPAAAGDLTRREVLVFLAGGACAVLAAGCTTRPTRPTAESADRGPIALTGATVVDVVAGKLVPGRTVLIRDGVIVGLFDPGDEALAGALAGARVVDCAGGFLIPGLINAHAHLNMPSLMDIRFGDLGLLRRQILRNYQDAVCWGVTTVRDMTAVPKVLLRDREAIDRGKLLGPHILSPLSFLTVPGGYPDFGGVGNPVAEWFTGSPALRTTDPAESRDFVKRVRDQGADLIKIGFDDRSLLWGRNDARLPVLSDAQVEAITAEAARAGLPVAAHHLYLDGLRRGLRFGVDGLEHVAMDGPLSDADLRAVVDAKLPLVPTVMIGAALAFRRDGVADPVDPVLPALRSWRDNVQVAEVPRHCTPEVAQRSDAVYRCYARGDYALPENRKREFFDPVLASRGVPVAAANVRRLIEAGAVLGVGNDSGVPLIFPGMVHLEMQLLHRLGMTPAQALRAATQVNATICRVADRCGTIEAGKRADLVLLAGDPLADVTAVGAVRAVFKSGILVSAAEGFPPAA
jgi:imidazolonepropionase-like amidohydrolase